MSELKNVIASNIIFLRKQQKFTQAELAEKLNYSDKAVSKWERSESIPDVETLKKVADLFDVTVDFLLTENAQQFVDKYRKTKKDKPNQLIITLLGVCMIWLIATVVYVSTQIIINNNFWMAFVWAVPASCLVLSIFNRKWGKKIYGIYIDSLFTWSLLASIYLQLLSYNLWMIFFVGVPIQIVILLWSKLRSK